jgi:3-(3-hydroxy-phenyl)propionate hydroxylase
MRDRNGKFVWLLEAVGGEETILHVPNGSPPPRSSRVLILGQDLADESGFFNQRFDTSPGSTYLVRPDQHLAARWRHANSSAVESASRRLRGLAGELL